MNKVMITGFMCPNLEVFTTKSEKLVCKFDLAVRRDLKTKEGVFKVDYPHFHCWNQGIVKFLKKYIKTGMLIEVEGQLYTDVVSPEGKMHKYTYVNVDRIASLDRGYIKKSQEKKAAAEAEKKAKAAANEFATMMSQDAKPLATEEEIAALDW